MELRDATMGRPWTCRPTSIRSTRRRPRRVAARASRPRGASPLVLLALTFVLRLPAFFVGLQLRRDVPRHPGPGDPTRRRALRGRHRPQAAARAVLYAATFAFFGTTALWSVRVVAMLAVALTALLLASRRRRRYGPRAGWIAGVLFVVAMVAFAPQDGQAANFEVFMLPSMTAAVLLARRGRGVAGGRRGRGRDAREADRRGDAAPGPVPAVRAARASGASPTVAVGFTRPDRAGRAGRRARASSSTGPCSATARTSA